MNKVRQAYNDLEIWRAKRLAMKSRKLHMAPPTVCEWEYQVVNIDTGKVKDKGRQLTHSFTRNYLNFLCLNSFFFSHDILYIGTTYAEGSLRLRDVGGVLHTSEVSYAPVLFTKQNSLGGLTSSVASGSSAIFAAAGSNYGIMFGTGNAAESLNDYKLETPLFHSAGVREYLITNRGNPEYNATTKMWSINWTRGFANLSGADIIIAEAGIYAYFNASATPIRLNCVLRDVLASPVTLRNNERINFTYRFSYVIS